MSTPMHLALMVCKHITKIGMVIFTALIICNFLYVLHTEHSSARQRLMDDQWLLKQCGEPDFYIRLKQHTDLCEGVEANARRSILLHSFSAALRTAQLCGFYSCTTIAQIIVDTIFRGGIITLAMTITLLFMLPMLCMVMYRKFVDTVAETHLRTKYNMPYGLNTSLLHSQQEEAAARVFNSKHFRHNAVCDSTAPLTHSYAPFPEYMLGSV
jgi:hypothetical protein